MSRIKVNQAQAGQLQFYNNFQLQILATVQQSHCPKQIIQFVQQSDFNIQNLQQMIDTLVLPKNHRKGLHNMQILASKQEQYLNSETTNTKSDQEELDYDPMSPKRILGKLSF